MRNLRSAFSLVEVAMALGVIGFVVLAVVGLLSVGMKSNQVSVEETRAALMLTLLEADLRNTHPGLAAGRSALFQLPLPYATNAAGFQFNAGISSGDFHTQGVDEAENVTDIQSGRPRFQVSVNYLDVPPQGDVRPATARLVVNWPATNTSHPEDVLNPAKVRGAVEALVTFPAP